MLEARAFEPDFLAKLDRLALGIKRARTARVGQRTLGRVQGIGIELENFKNYTEGEDLRFLDWNAFARLDDLLLRTYRATRQVEVTLIVDASASMGVPRADDKLGFALMLGAALAYLGINENDVVRMISFGMHRGKMRLERSILCSRREMYPRLKPFVIAVRPEGATRLSAMTELLLAERRSAGLVILISDFLVKPSDYEQALSRLVAARHEVKVLHVMGERESIGDLRGNLMRIRDVESGEIRELALGDDAGARYRRRVEDLAERLREFCSRHAVTYVRAFGASNLDRIITGELPRMGLVV